MASFTAFADPYIIGSDHHTPMTHRQWMSYEDDFSFSSPYESLPSSKLALSNVSMHNMSSMQRFFGGADESPFTANPFHSSLRKLEMAGGLRPHNVAIPENFPRGGSPADTASSANSYWTTNHSEYATDHLGRPSVSSQSAYSPSMLSCDGYEVAPLQQPLFAPGGGCVSLNSIQQYDPDQTHEEPEECPIANCTTMPQSYDHVYEQYHIKTERYDSHQECDDVDEKPSTTTDNEGSEEVEGDRDEEGSDTEYKPHRRSSFTAKRPRRRSSQSSNGSARSNKRCSRGRKESTSSPSTGRVEKSKCKNDKGAGNRHFPCPLARYGCSSSFTSKNEWKRHVSTQHIKLVYWRCDLCAPNFDPKNPTYNDFNRKDLFTQHLRRMHANVDANGNSVGSATPKKGASLTNVIPEDVIAVHQKRCCKDLRQLPPQSGCLFCSRSFAGKDSWLERMDHIGSHLEKGRKNNEHGNMADHHTWIHDQILEDWLLDEGLVVRDEKSHWKLGDGTPLRLK